MGDMVRAVIADRKTQTRRLIRFDGYPKDDQPDPDAIRSARHQHDNVWLFTDQQNGDGNYACAKSKYRVGDILYVKETWAPHFMWTGIKPSEITIDERSCLFYRADESITGGCQMHQREKNWRTSQFMPYAVARLFLKVVDVRPERLNDISCEDSIAEGIEFNYPYYRDYLDPKSDGYLDTIQTQWPKEVLKYYAEQASYRTLWESINGPGSWLANPWVWVYTFERTQKPA